MGHLGARRGVPYGKEFRGVGGQYRSEITKGGEISAEQMVEMNGRNRAGREVGGVYRGGSGEKQ